MIIQYIKQGRKKKGVVVAEKIGGKVKFGWSLCNKRDKFDKEFGKQIAIERMLCDRVLTVPKSVDSVIRKSFGKRVTRYFKDTDVVLEYKVK